jgi:hypothetical protein
MLANERKCAPATLPPAFNPPSFPYISVHFRLSLPIRVYLRSFAVSSFRGTA